MTSSDRDVASGPGSPRAIGPGETVGRYRIGHELGAGGMASVFAARDTELRRDVAVKVLFAHLAGQDEFTRRFQREARAAAGLDHPNILRVYDVGGGHDRTPPYIVMELVRGRSLREVLEETGPLLAELVACIGALACDALAVAHRAGIVHRDVKPANLMLAADGRLLLADFGVARLDDDDSLVTRTGALLGTPSFMAPEQGLGQAVDARSDVYSVGALMYQLATGSLPYAGSAAKIVTEAAKATALPPVRRRPAVGGELSHLIEQMMAADPARRPDSASAAAAALRAHVTAGGLGDPVDEVREFARDPSQWESTRRKVVVARLVERASAGRAQIAVSQALGLVDRALALAPDDPTVSALATGLSQPPPRRALPAVIAAVTVGCVGAGYWAFAGDHAVVAPRAADAGMGLAIELSGSDGSAAVAPEATASGPVVDAALPVVMKADAREAPRAGASSSELRARAVRMDAGVADAALDLSSSDASPGSGVDNASVTFSFDTWCDLSIDGGPATRADPTKRHSLPPGRHSAACTQGPGLPSWSGTFEVRSGGNQRIDGALLASVAVTMDAGDSVKIGAATYLRGAKVLLRPGRYRVTVYEGHAVTAERHVDIPRIARCAIRALPVLDCYRS